MRAERFARTAPPKFSRPRYPYREELLYYRRLRYFVDLVHYVIERDIVPHLPALLDERAPTLRTDSAGDIDKAFDAAAAAAAKALPQEIVEAAAQSTALRVTEWSADQFQRQVQKVVKVNLYDDQSGLAEHLELFVSDNVKLINSLTGRHLEDVKGIVTRAARAGTHHTEVRDQIQKQLGVTRNRAALIATDQIGKLNGEVNRIRQTNLGIRRYRWSTSQDEKVRHSHRALEGQIFEWKNPPVVNPKTGERGHPGQPIRCRCSAIPIIDDVLADAGLIDPGDVELTHPRQGEQPPLRSPPALLPGSNRPPPAPTPPTPPAVSPPAVAPRQAPPIDPAAALRLQLPSQAKATALETARLLEEEATVQAAQLRARQATGEADRDYIATVRKARPKPPPARAKPKAGALPPKRRKRPRKTGDPDFNP